MNTYILIVQWFLEAQKLKLKLEKALWIDI